MSANLLRALHLPDIAHVLRSKGRAHDTILAHINPKEAALLRAHGGAETINPATGLPEYDDTGVTEGYFDNSTPKVDYNLNVDTPSNTGLTTGYFSGQQASPDYSLNLDTGNNYQTPSFQSGSPAPTRISGGSADTSFSTGGAAAFPGATPSTFGGGSLPIGDQVAAAVGGNQPGAPNAPATEPSLYDKTTDFLGKHKDLASLVGIGGLQAFNQHRASQQAAASEKRIKALAAPYSALSSQYLDAARTGNLLPGQQQQLNALRAQAAQNLSNAGQTSGIAAQQAEANVQQQAEVFRQNLMQSGLQLAGISDQLSLEAINAGYQADQQAQKASSDFYLALFNAIGKSGK